MASQQHQYQRIILDQNGLVWLGTAAAMLVVLPIAHSPTRRMLVTWISKLKYQLDHRYDQKSSNSINSDDITVSGLYVHPIKSCRLVSVPEATLDRNGLVGDRRFMLVVDRIPPLYGFLKHDATHTFLSQRQCPSLATVSVEWKTTTTTKAELKLQSKVGGRLHIDLLSQTKRGKTIRARVWSDVVEVQDMGDDAAAYFRKVIDNSDYESVRLVQLKGTRYSKDCYVPVEARRWTGEAPLTGLTDGFPILIASEASLEEVNRRLKAQGKASIPMSRFRPNIVIRGKGLAPFEEDSWKRIRIVSSDKKHKVELQLVKGCPRCRQSCTDQLTGKVSDEPLQVLSEFRALGTHKEEVFFAQNAVAVSGKTLQVGATVEVLERGDPVWDRGEATPPE